MEDARDREIEADEGAAISAFNVALDRRGAATHPGPILKRDYLDVLGFDVVSFASRAGIDPTRLGAMLEGRRSIDVDSAVRIARLLQLPAERIMQMQLHCDFAALRGSPGIEALEVLAPLEPELFPETFIRGRLARAGDNSRGQAPLYFQQDVEGDVTGDAYAGLHTLWRGDRLRVYDASERAFWVGPVLHNLEGGVMLPFVAMSEWQGWFAASLRADLAIGAEHAAFFERMRDA